MLLRELLAGTPIFEICGSREIFIEGLAVETDDIRPNDLYIYMCDREKMSYEESIKKAIARGAVAICIGKDYEVLPYDITFIKTYNVKRFLSAISKNFYQNPSQNIDMIGITGSHGKTTIGNMIRSILKSAGIPTVMIDTSSCRLGDDPPYIHEDILNPVVFMEFLNEAIARGIERGIVECSYTAIVEERLRHIWFDSLIYTDLYTYFKNREMDYHYLEIRKTLIDHLKHIKCPIIVNMDDYHANELTSGNIVGYGIYGNYNVTAKNITLMPDGSNFTICTPMGNREFTLALPGLHNVYNAMAAIGWCITEGIDFSHIEEGLEQLEHFENVQYNVDADITNPIHIQVHNYSRPRDIPEILEDIHLESGYDNRSTILCVSSCENTSEYGEVGRALNEFSRHCIMTSDYRDRYNYVDGAFAIVQNMQDANIHNEIDHYKALKKARSLVKDGGSIVILTKDSCEL
ncbi:MAG TPA: hypothetical protein GX392_07480 [Clostridiales bacterium]|nr:hypothetical protein [Clostridiales bacterium]